MAALKELIQLGLSENEARTYLAALELGPSTAQQIALKAQVNRPTTYVQIDNLMELGLMSSYTQNKKTYFIAEHPEHLAEILKHREQEIAGQKKFLKEIMPELRELFVTTQERPKVRFYEGKEGILAMAKDIFNTNKKEILSITPVDLGQQVFSKEELREFQNIRNRRKIKVKSLYTKSEKTPHTPPSSTVEGRYIPPDKFPISAGVDIYDNKIAAYALRGKLVGVIVESNEISDTFRSIFQLAWESSQKYNR